MTNTMVIDVACRESGEQKQEKKATDWVLNRFMRRAIQFLKVKGERVYRAMILDQGTPFERFLGLMGFYFAGLVVLNYLAKGALLLMAAFPALAPIISALISVLALAFMLFVMIRLIILMTQVLEAVLPS